MLTARLVGTDDFDAIDALRVSSYQRATWFTLKDAERIRCARDLEGSRVTAVYDDHIAVATVCQTLMRNRAQAETLLECDAPLEDSEFPALVISRAATADGYAGLRLNHVLRRYTLLAAQREDVRSIIASHAAGTPNLRAMGELGYDFVPVNSRMSQVEVLSQHVLSHLPQQRFAPALTRLEELLGAQRDEIEWRGAALSFATSRVQAA